jgi:peptidoglycan/xylan/chitin deacetylase (PgdA/CDA1 family)
MRARLLRGGRRAAQAALLPLSVLPLLLVGPLLVTAYSQFDRRHKSGPIPAPAVTFTARERARYRVLPAHPGRVPGLAYGAIGRGQGPRSVSPTVFARHMALVRRLGFRALSIADYARLLRGDTAGLPDRPVLITFDGGRLDAFRHADHVLRRYGLRATMFVPAALVGGDAEDTLTWRELSRMDASDRWDVQAEATTGEQPVAHDAAGSMGAAYAYRRFTRAGGEETRAAWERRVTGDVLHAIDALADHLPHYRPVAFAVPGGNAGQLGTNDPQVPALLGGLLRRQFAVTFVRDARNYPGYTSSHAHHGFAARYAIGATTTTDDLFRWLRDRAPASPSPTTAP